MADQANQGTVGALGHPALRAVGERFADSEPLIEIIAVGLAWVGGVYLERRFRSEIEDVRASAADMLRTLAKYARNTWGYDLPAKLYALARLFLNGLWAVLVGVGVDFVVVAFKLEPDQNSEEVVRIAANPRDRLLLLLFVAFYAGTQFVFENVARQQKRVPYPYRLDDWEQNQIRRLVQDGETEAVAARLVRTAREQRWRAGGYGPPGSVMSLVLVLVLAPLFACVYVLLLAEFHCALHWHNALQLLFHPLSNFFFLCLVLPAFVAFAIAFAAVGTTLTTAEKLISALRTLYGVFATVVQQVGLGLLPGSREDFAHNTPRFEPGLDEGLESAKKLHVNVRLAFIVILLAGMVIKHPFVNVVALGLMFVASAAEWVQQNVFKETLQHEQLKRFMTIAGYATFILYAVIVFLGWLYVDTDVQHAGQTVSNEGSGFWDMVNASTLSFDWPQVFQRLIIATVAWAVITGIVWWLQKKQDLLPVVVAKVLSGLIALLALGYFFYGFSSRELVRTTSFVAPTVQVAVNQPAPTPTARSLSAQEYQVRCLGPAASWERCFADRANYPGIPNGCRDANDFSRNAFPGHELPCP